MKISSLLVKMCFAFFFLFLTQSAFADGGGDKGDQKAPTNEQLQEQIKALTRRNEELEAQAKKSKKKKFKAKDDNEDDDDDEDDFDDEDDNEDDDDNEDGLETKVRKAENRKLKREKNDKQIEAALTLNLTVEQFIKENSDILPSEIEAIVKQAHKETYSTALEKANAIRAGIIKSFFDVQSNLELLTSSQKNKLEDYFKKTIGARHERAAEIYSDIFEPTLELIKKIKKAEEVGRARNGFAGDSKQENEYLNRLMKQSNKTYLGERSAG